MDLMNKKNIAKLCAIIVLIFLFLIIQFREQMAEPPPPNLPPHADAGGNQTVGINDIVELNASGSYDPDGYIVAYLWDFDASDGIDFSNPDATGEVVYTSYNESGEYTVTLKVIDNKGAHDIDSCVITVINRPPVANPNGPYYINEGDSVTLDASASYDPDGTIVQWQWDLNND